MRHPGPHSLVVITALLGCGGASPAKSPPDAAAIASSMPEPTPDAEAVDAWHPRDAWAVDEGASPDAAAPDAAAPDVARDTVAHDGARPEDEYPLVPAPMRMLFTGPVDLIAIDETNIYWSTGDAVKTMRKAGGLTRTMFMRRSSQRQLIVTDQWIIGMDDQGLWRSLKTRGPAMKLNELSTGAMAVDDAYVYVALLSVGLVDRIPLAGGEPEPLVRLPHEPAALAVDDRFVYAAIPQGIARFSKVPASPPVDPELLADVPLRFGAMVLAGDSVVFSDRAGRGRDIWSVPKAGGELTKVFRSANVILDGLALAGHDLFWTGGAQELVAGEAMTLDLNGRQARRLTQGLGFAHSPVADGENCYFVIDQPLFVGPSVPVGIAAVRYVP